MKYCRRRKYGRGFQVRTLASPHGGARMREPQKQLSGGFLAIFLLGADGYKFTITLISGDPVPALNEQALGQVLPSSFKDNATKKSLARVPVLECGSKKDARGGSRPLSPMRSGVCRTRTGVPGELESIA